VVVVVIVVVLVVPGPDAVLDKYVHVWALNFTHKSGVKGIHGVHLALYAILVVVYCTGMSLYLVFSVQGHPYDVAVKTPILLCRIILGVRV
jgi:hypothetical protein